jgi:hypothetical protein
MPWDKERIMNDLTSGFLAMFQCGRNSAESFTRQFSLDPDKALDILFKIYEVNERDAYTDDETGEDSSWIKSIAGGPHESLSVPIANALGLVYPHLTREQKDKGLKQLLNIYDGINSIYVANIHTPYVREPLLLSDIELARWVYWPGLGEAESLIKSTENPFDLMSEIIDDNGLFYRDKVKSDYLVAYGLIRRDIYSFAEHYTERANPDFIEKVVKGIVNGHFGFLEKKKKFREKNYEREELERDDEDKRAMSEPFFGMTYGDFLRAQSDNNLIGKEAEYDSRLREWLPKKLHPLIDRFREERDWTSIEW